MKKPNITKVQKICDEFNQKYPIGTYVILKKDSGEFTTSVQSAAFVLGGHSAVAFFHGVSGCYAIEGRVRRVKP